MKKNTATKLDIKKWCMWWGIGVIIGGLLLMYFSNMIIGAIILFLGVVTIILRKDWNLAVIGTLIILLGGANLINAITSGEYFSIWAFFQILIGVWALIEYYRAGATNSKKIVLIGITLLCLIILITTFSFEATYNTESYKLELTKDYFTSNDTIYSESALNRGLVDGTYTIEDAYKQLTDIELSVNESEMKMIAASRYSLVTYTRWSSLSERNEYTDIWADYCRSSISMERTLIEGGVFTNKCVDTTGCDNGWCRVAGTNYCCPRANMEIIDGRCSQK